MLDRNLHVQISREASTFDTKNHARFLAEVVQSLTRTQRPDPVLATLELLIGLWNSGYAERPDERRALNDVGRWLENKVLRNPSIAAATLAEEVAWLRRLSKYHEKNTKTGAGQDKTKVAREFGDKLDSLRQKRQQAAISEAKKVVKAEVVPEKVELPEILELEFVDFVKAREVYGNLKKRLDKKKEVTETLLEARPKDEKLRAAGNLVVSTTTTEGFVDWFKVVLTKGGGARPFRARQGQRRVEKII